MSDKIPQPMTLKRDSEGLECPVCQSRSFTGVEYQAGQPESYDGTSEWQCNQCASRFGRWSGRLLIAGDIERRYGGVNP